MPGQRARAPSEPSGDRGPDLAAARRTRSRRRRSSRLPFPRRELDQQPRGRRSGGAQLGSNPTCDPRASVERRPQRQPPPRPTTTTRSQSKSVSSSNGYASSFRLPPSFPFLPRISHLLDRSDLDSPLRPSAPDGALDGASGWLTPADVDDPLYPALPPPAGDRFLQTPRRLLYSTRAADRRPGPRGLVDEVAVNGSDPPDPKAGDRRRSTRSGYPSSRIPITVRRPKR